MGNSFASAISSSSATHSEKPHHGDVNLVLRIYATASSGALHGEQVLIPELTPAAINSCFSLKDTPGATASTFVETVRALSPTSGTSQASCWNLSVHIDASVQLGELLSRDCSDDALALDCSPYFTWTSSSRQQTVSLFWSFLCACIRLTEQLFLPSVPIRLRCLDLADNKLRDTDLFWIAQELITRGERSLSCLAASIRYARKLFATDRCLSDPTSPMELCPVQCSSLITAIQSEVMLHTFANATATTNLEVLIFSNPVKLPITSLSKVLRCLFQTALSEGKEVLVLGNLRVVDLSGPEGIVDQSNASWRLVAQLQSRVDALMGGRRVDIFLHSQRTEKATPSPVFVAPQMLALDDDSAPRDKCLMMTVPISASTQMMACGASSDDLMQGDEPSAFKGRPSVESWCDDSLSEEPLPNEFPADGDQPPLLQLSPCIVELELLEISGRIEIMAGTFSDTVLNPMKMWLATPARRLCNSTAVKSDSAFSEELESWMTPLRLVNLLTALLPDIVERVRRELNASLAPEELRGNRQLPSSLSARQRAVLDITSWLESVDHDTTSFDDVMSEAHAAGTPAGRKLSSSSIRHVVESMEATFSSALEEQVLADIAPRRPLECFLSAILSSLLRPDIIAVYEALCQAVLKAFSSLEQLLRDALLKSVDAVVGLFRRWLVECEIARRRQQRNELRKSEAARGVRRESAAEAFDRADAEPAAVDLRRRDDAGSSPTVGRTVKADLYKHVKSKISLHREASSTSTVKPVSAPPLHKNCAEAPSAVTATHRALSTAVETSCDEDKENKVSALPSPRSGIRQLHQDVQSSPLIRETNATAIKKLLTLEQKCQQLQKENEQFQKEAKRSSLKMSGPPRCATPPSSVLHDFVMPYKADVVADKRMPHRTPATPIGKSPLKQKDDRRIATAPVGTTATQPQNAPLPPKAIQAINAQYFSRSVSSTQLSELSSNDIDELPVPCAAPPQPCTAPRRMPSPPQACTAPRTTVSMNAINADHLSALPREQWPQHPAAHHVLQDVGAPCIVSNTTMSYFSSQRVPAAHCPAASFSVGRLIEQGSLHRGTGISLSRHDASTLALTLFSPVRATASVSEPIRGESALAPQTAACNAASSAVQSSSAKGKNQLVFTDAVSLALQKRCENCCAAPIVSDSVVNYILSGASRSASTRVEGSSSKGDWAKHTAENPVVVSDKGYWKKQASLSATSDVALEQQWVDLQSQASSAGTRHKRHSHRRSTSKSLSNDRSPSPRN